MEEINAVSPQDLSLLRSKFLDKVSSESSVVDERDVSRVKTDDLWLRRFIAHGEGSVETASTLLWDCCKWRKEFGTNDLNESQLDGELLKKGTLFIRGEDKWGKKLLIFKAKSHLKGSIPIETIQKFVVYYFDRIERETRSDQISIIFDMKDTGWNNMDMDFVRYLITLLKTYYPYFVNYLIIYEMPWLLNAAWKIIKGWLPPKFVDRVKFQDKKNLSEYIEPKFQLSEWGGQDNYTYSFVPEVKGPKQAGNLGPISAPSKVKASKQIQFAEEPPSSRLLTPSPQSSLSAELADVEERLVFRPEGEDEYGAELRVRNKSQAPIAVKIKTTTPERYRVRPIVSVVGVGGEGVVHVSSHSGVLAAGIGRDRFQVQVVEVSNAEDVNREEVAGVFKKVHPETYRVGVVVEARAGESSSAGSKDSLSLSDDRLKRGLEDLEAKVADRVAERVSAQVSRLRKEVIALLGAVTFALLAFVIFMFNQQSKVCAN